MTGTEGPQVKKLGTRETGWALAFILHALAIYLIATLPDAQKLQVFEALVVPDMTFLAFAFGAKVYQARTDK